MSDQPHPSPIKNAPQGTVLNVSHIPTENGEKLATRIVLKGHPLQVPWRSTFLHHTTSPELNWKPADCIYCQQCSQVCPKGCLHLQDDGLEINHQVCDQCGECLRECPSMALEMIGKQTTAGNLLHKTLKQNYTTARKISQISISGGEPGLQSAFCADLLFQIEAAGIPSILETSGLAAFENLLPLLAYPEQVNFELISTDNSLHTRLTGSGNRLILENLIRVGQEILASTSLVVRTPLIRQETATAREIRRTGSWLAANLMPGCQQWELFAPHAVCEPFQPFSQQEWAQFEAWAASSDFPAKQIRVCN